MDWVVRDGGGGGQSGTGAAELTLEERFHQLLRTVAVGVGWLNHTMFVRY